MTDPEGLLRCYRVVAVAGGLDSAPSNTWCKDMRPAPAPNIPNAPTGLGGD
jgi:hypothetical protein